MGSYIKLLWILILPFCLFAKTSQAPSVDKQNIEQGPLLFGSYFATGPTVSVEQTVPGNAYICAGQALISGVIEGDLLLACGGAEISGVVKGSVLVIGGQVSISGSVGKHVTVMAGNIQCLTPSHIQGKLVAASANAELFGEINGSVSLWVSHVQIGGTIHSNVSAVVDDIEITSSASIDGSVNYDAEESGIIDPQARIDGPLKYHPSMLSHLFQAHTVPKLLLGLNVFGFFMHLVFNFLLGWILIYLFPHKLQMTISMLEHQKGLCLGYGVIAIVLAPIICLAFFITIIGAPLALALVTFNIFGFYIARLIVILWLADKVVKRFHIHHRRLLPFLFGIIVYDFITLIPFIGSIAGLLSVLFGVGAVVLAQKDRHVFLPESKRT